MTAPLGLQPRPAFGAAAAAIAIMVTGGVLTTLGPWWEALLVPSWKPPDWVFGPAWTAIFTLWAAAAALAWQAADTPSGRQRLVGLFGLNGLLNIAWSGLFFALRRPDWALVEVVLLWVSVATLIGVVRPRRAAALLVPYIVWVTFAAVLNLAIVRLNPDIGSAAGASRASQILG